MEPAAAKRDELLAQPTRARLFTLLGERGRPCATEELAGALGLHPNGVRTHLERLAAAGLVERERVRRPRGRPRDEWSLPAGVRPEPDPRALADLGRWLVRAIPPEPARLREVEAAGREVGRGLAPKRAAPAPAEEVSTEAAHGLRDAFAALGFAPTVETYPGGISCTLGNCPYRDAARGGQEVVCTLHRGLTTGLLEVLEPGARLTRFVPRDPDQAGCLVEIEVPA